MCIKTRPELYSLTRGATAHTRSYSDLPLTMLVSVSLLYILAYLVDSSFSKECGLRLEQTQRTIFKTKGTDLTILCNASCFGPLSANQIAWYNRNNEQLSDDGRVSFLTYNRGMYIRLIISNAQVYDTGRYACAGSIDGTAVREGININIIEPESNTYEEDVHSDDERRRGDVRVEEPLFPRRRPSRDVSFLRLFRRRREATTFMPDDESSNSWSTSSPETSSASESSSVQTTESSNSPFSSSEPEPTFGSGEVDTNSESQSSSVSILSMTSSKSGMTSGKESAATTMSVTTPSVGPARTSAPETEPPPPSSTKKQQTTPLLEPSTDETTNKGKSGKSISGSPDTSESTTRTVIIDTHNPEATTAFGRYGLLAFALALSTAFLLLYALILLNVILPRCCRNRQSVNFRSEINQKSSGPTAVDAVALKPLQVESQPNSPDIGFTTVDLDDHKPEEKKPEVGQNGAPASPTASSEPQSPSKYVTTFVIGRKPSTNDPDAVFLHEGKPGETIINVPEVPEVEKSTTEQSKQKDESGQKDESKPKDESGQKDESKPKDESGLKDESKPKDESGQKDESAPRSSTEVKDEKEVDTSLDTSKDTGMDTSTDTSAS